MAPSPHADCEQWAFGTNRLQQPRPGRMALPNGLSDRSGASAWTMSSSWARYICVEFQNLTPITTTAHQNTHLSMLLKRRDFADWDAIPWGILGSVALVRR